MSYRPHESAFALLTGAIAPNQSTNASPSDKSTSQASWITMPAGTNDGVSFSEAVLMAGFPGTNVAARARLTDLNTNSTIWRESCHMTVYAPGANWGLGYETSDDEVLIHRSSAAEVKVGTDTRYNSSPFTGPSWDATYSRFCVWRMS